MRDDVCVYIYIYIINSIFMLFDWPMCRDWMRNNWVITLTTWAKIKRMKTKLVKILYNKFGLNDEIENKLIFYKNAKKKN